MGSETEKKLIAKEDIPSLRWDLEVGFRHRFTGLRTLLVVINYRGILPFLNVVFMEGLAN